MARAIFIFLIAALAAALVVWLVSNPGWVTADWLGYRFEAPMSMTAILLLVLFAVLSLVLRLVGMIAGGPAAWRRFFTQRRARRGMGALTEGLAAAAAGDAGVAHRQAAKAGKLVKDGPLARVLALEAAELEGREDDVAALAPTLLVHPETELLGRRALFNLARTHNDRSREIDAAEAAFETHPAAGWAAEALLGDAVRSKDWDRARSILVRADRHDAFSDTRTGKIKSALMLAEADDLGSRGEDAKALGLTRKAWEADRDFVAAAVKKAERLVATGKSKRAGEIAQQMWARRPHPVLGQIFAAPRPDETQDDRLSRLRALVSNNPDHVESRLLVAEHAIAARHIIAAREALKPLLEAGSSARAYALMAAVDRAELGAAADGQEWIEKALAAPRDAVWVCGSCGHRELHWYAVCPRCSSVATAEWATHRPHFGTARSEVELAKPKGEVTLSERPRNEMTKSPPEPAPETSIADELTEEQVPDASEPVRQPDDPGADNKKEGKEGAEW